MLRRLNGGTQLWRCSTQSQQSSLPVCVCGGQWPSSLSPPSYLPLKIASYLDFRVFYKYYHFPPVNGCPTASCDFGALTGRDECTYFYSVILNRNLLTQHSVSVKQLFCFCLLILVLTRQYNKLEICELIINCILLNFLCKVFA